ncbi:MAG: DUF6268 family outer membrane beta-barrel protein [Candidatus Omnitrophica bacterium]|nr:DUF6268 family outer membrane beta-barrel protein [Candidatus Omnitrophota bacterium]
MLIKVTGKRGALFLLLGVFIFSLLLLDVYADEGRERAQEQAIQAAQESDDPSALDYRQKLGKPIVVEEEFFRQELDSYVRFMPNTGAKCQSGKVGLVTAASEYNYNIKAFDQLPIQFAVISKYIGIHNSTAVQLPAKLTAASFGMETTLPFFNLDKTYLTIGLAPSFFSDNWNFNSSTFSLIQRYFMIYQPNEKLTLIAGVEYSPGFRPALDPIVGFIYRPNDRLTFNITPSNPEIAYDFSKRWTVFAQGDYLSDEYKVKQGDLKNLVLNYNEIRLGAGLRCAINKNIKASLACGSVFDRSIKYKENNLGKVALDNGFYSEFRLDIIM